MCTLRRAGRLAIGVLVVGYLSWNGYWLLRGKLPDSIFRALTHLPCPTTGGTRSIEAYWRGDWKEGVCYNPLTPVFIALFLSSLVVLGNRYFRHRRVSLPTWMARAWFVSLGTAWAAKFVLGPDYW
jgi:hypothetical protein